MAPVRYAPHFLLTLLLSLSFASTALHAGGPLIISGPDGHTPVRYQDPTIILHAEGGDLGTRTNDQADALVDDAISLWNGVSSSALRLQVDQDSLDFDIDISNFEIYLPTIDNSDLNADDSYNPIVYDEGGEIIDAYFGVGASLSVIGVAASVTETGFAYFIEGYAVINGRDDLSLDDNLLRLLIAHEIGHFFGLDHTQTNISNQESDFSQPFLCQSAGQEDYALMYPFICRETVSLHADDKSAISALYPSSDIDEQYGILQGRLLDDNNNALLGANIWAENVTTGTAISIVSDYLLQRTGFYRLYLPPGDYTLHANSINTLFTGASGVGPYSDSSSDVSFTSPHPIGQVDYLGTSDNQVAVLSIAANQTQEVTFNTLGQFVEGVASTAEDDDSLADLFGSTSIITILLLSTGLLGLRRISGNG